MKRTRTLGVLVVLALGSFTVPADPAGAAGTVVAGTKNGNFIVKGDEEDNKFIIEGTGVGSYDVTGFDGTLINGGASTSVTGVTGKTTIITKDGNDEIDTHDATFPHHVTIKSGNDDDVIDLTDTTIEGNLKIASARDDDAVRFYALTLAGNLAIRTSSGEDSCLVSDGSSVAGRTSLSMGPDADTVQLDLTSSFGDKVAVKGGGDDDVVTIDDVVFDDVTSFSLGGDDDELHYANSTFTGISKMNGGSGTDTDDDQGGNTFVNGVVKKSFELP